MSQTKSCTRVTIALSIAFVLVGLQPAHAEWPQWGGPDRNFTVDTSRLADQWPEGGPKRLWHRPLGTGYSGIAVDDGVLYTMYRTEKKDTYEYTVALNAKTGKTLWKNKQMAAVPSETKDFGTRFTGPNATPLVVGDRVYSIGRNAILHCFQKTDGKVLWKHALVEEFGAQAESGGYSNSPIAYGKTISAPVGRVDADKSEGRSLIAFDQESGEVVWKSQTFQIDHSSPILITLSGEEQLVQCTKKAVIGVDPKTGALIWEYKYPGSADDYSSIFATPVWNGKDTLFFSSGKLGCAIKLAKSKAGTSAAFRWSSKKTALGMGTPILMDDLLIGPKRGRVALFLGVDIHTGKREWLKRLFPSSTVLGGGGKLIVLDQEGQLALVTATREDLTVVSQCQVTEKESFTAPVLVGTTLYVRDEKNIMAYDLGSAPTRETS
ncbi:MAG: PQQ-binding-like beta-propeller repeat protein [Planctomycetes bacterium]|nr:PQQ-binding-like beta-propeller repeat protein [Planctomycetota bacterium]